MNELTPNAQLRIQYWLDIIHQCRESGQSNSQWCAENGISIKSYYYWLAKIRKMAVEELPRKKHAFCQTERILCRCNCKRHRRCADNHPGTSGRLYQSAFRNRKKSGSTVTHRQKEQRLTQEKPVLDAFWSWAETASAGILPKSKLGEAFTYAFNQKEGLMNYLQDGNCSISNNLAENSIRPFTIGRKNWLFSGSPRGAEASAGIYTLIETAKVNGLNPRKYIQYILSDIPGSDFRRHPEFLEDYLPWNAAIQKNCR